MEEKEIIPTTCGECSYYRGDVEFLGECSHEGNRYDRVKLDFIRPSNCPLVVEEERKQKLIEALKAERLRFMQRGGDSTEHDIAIDYLIKGKTSSNPNSWELLDAVMNDFDTVCSDYGC